MKNPLPFGLTALGALAMTIGTFLPSYESRRFLRIEGNTMVQSADGWILIALAVGIVVCAYKADDGDKNYRIATWILPLIGAGCLLVIWLNKGARTLYPIGLDGTPVDDAPGEVAGLGIGFYLAAVGVGLAATGTRLLWDATKSPREDTDEDSDDDDVDIANNTEDDVRRTTLGDLMPRNKALKQRPVDPNH